MGRDYKLNFPVIECIIWVLTLTNVVGWFASMHFMLESLTCVTCELLQLLQYQVVTERSSSTKTDIPSYWFLVCTLLIITLKFNRTKISGCLPRHVFDVINFISLSFLQQTLQISSNILDKKNKAQWDELQEVHSRVYLLSKNFNLVSPSRKVGICTHYMPTIRPCSWRSTHSWSIFFPFTLSLRPQQKHKEGADLSQQICHSLRSFRNKYPTC